MNLINVVVHPLLGQMSEDKPARRSAIAPRGMSALTVGIDDTGEQRDDAETDVGSGSV